jgi:hypothetical protein
VESTQQAQSISKVRVYPGADASFTLFSDDGKTYAYEKGAGTVTRLDWDEAQQKLSRQGDPAWSGPDSAVVEVVGR